MLENKFLRWALSSLFLSKSSFLFCTAATELAFSPDSLFYFITFIIYNTLYIIGITIINKMRSIRSWCKDDWDNREKSTEKMMYERKRESVMCNINVASSKFFDVPLALYAISHVYHLSTNCRNIYLSINIRTWIEISTPQHYAFTNKCFQACCAT